MHQALAALRSLCTEARAVQEPLDRRAWAYAMLYVNLYGLQLLYSARKFGQVFLTRTVRMYSYMYSYSSLYLHMCSGGQVCEEP